MKNMICNNTKLYSLTHPQKRIWYIEKIYPGTPLYNIGGVFRIKGSVVFGVLEESINLLIKNNEGLRLRFIEENGEAKQYVSNYERTKLDFFDFSKHEDPEGEFKKWVEKEAQKPLALVGGELFYFALFKISDNNNGYLVKFHHIISDGWSTKLMTEYICDTYMRLLNREEIIDDESFSYIEYILNEKKYLLSDRFLKNKSFWNDKFKVLPDAFLSKSSDIIEGKRRKFALEPELSSQMKKFATNHKCSLNTFFVTLYLLYLNKITRNEDIVIGTPVLNRSGKKEKSMFGMFTSTMPFRFTVDDDSNIMDTMVKVNDQLTECYFNQKYPYDLLIQDLELKKKGYNSLFNICINYYNTKHYSELNGFSVEPVEFYNGNQLYSLELVIQDWSDSGSLVLDFHYKVHDYTEEQIEDMFVRLLGLTRQMITNSSEKVGRLSLLTDDETKKVLYDFNNTQKDYPKDKTIVQLFEDQVNKMPDKTAISFDTDELTYRELNEKANQLARYLVERGIKKDTVIGLLTTHSLETVIGILGILKAGGAYLPIDPVYPDDRIHYMLKDSGSGTLLTNLDLSEGIKFEGETINLNDHSIYSGDASDLEAMSKSKDMAYVIYTSGSTGKPKGTMVEHRGLVNYIWWAKKMYASNENEVFPLYSSLAFDLTITSIFTPLISGGKIIVYADSDEKEYVLYRIMKEKKATLIKLTPSHLALLKDMDNVNSSVKKFIVGGEDLKVSLAKDIYKSFRGNIEIFNEYGPTETVVGCMIHKFDYKTDIRVSVPIGNPADNVQIYILDKNLNPVPQNSSGEIYISGDGVARGYLNRPDLTEERFIENPFINGKRMYKSGDLGRFLNDGKIEYTGRADQQIKIRGYRIETGEIEKHLLNHDSIKDAVVIDRENNNSKYLYAYIVKKSQISTGDLKDFLLRYLPDYMIPMYFIQLDEIPLSINGKVNRELLPEPESEFNENIEFTAFKDEKEKTLIDVMCRVLNIDRVSLKHNFFHLGGDSIKAIQIAAKLKEKNYNIRVKDILSNPIIEEMALHIEANKCVDVEDEACEGSIHPTPVISWFLSQDMVYLNHYCQSVLLQLKQNIGVNILEETLAKLIKHHDALRINYNMSSREFFYNNDHQDKEMNIEFHDLSEFENEEQNRRIADIGERLKSSFNIEEDLLIKACIFHCGIRGDFLLIAVHHLAVDGVSWRILLEDFYSTLKGLTKGEEIALPHKTNSYQMWAGELLNYSKRIVLSETGFWNSMLNTDSDMLAREIKKSNQEISPGTLVHFLEFDGVKGLNSANAAYGTKTSELILTSLVLTLSDFFETSEVTVEIESHGRENLFDGIDISRTVGWFTSIYPVAFKVDNNDLGKSIKLVKEAMRSIPNNGIGFGVLKYLSGVIEAKNTRYVRLNYLGSFDAVFDNELFSYSDEYSGSDSRLIDVLKTCLFDINVMEINNTFKVTINYDENEFINKNIPDLFKTFISKVGETINYCIQKEDVEFTPSDFGTATISIEELNGLFD